MKTTTDAERLKQIEAMYEKAKRRFPDISDVSAEELQRMRADGDVVVVDVRTPEEQEASMIPGAITVEQFEANQQDYEGKTIVSYCTMGGRSGMYTRELQTRGWRALNLKGAILAWTHAGGELENAQGPTRKVHTHGRKFSLAAEGYEQVW